MNPTPTAVGRRVPGEQGLSVSFYLDAVESPLKSAEEGRPVFDNVEHIEIRIPGDANTIIKSLVSNEYKSRFPDEYAAFKRDGANVESGTPLKTWSVLTPAQVAMLNSQNVRTVEQLAEMSDGNANFMGNHDLRAKAKAWLKATADAAVVEKQDAEMAELRAEIAALKADKKTK